MEANWIKLSDKKPNVKEHGDSVLVYRIPTDGQCAMSICIYDTAMIKHCDKNETWWMELPNEELYKQFKKTKKQ